MTPEQLGAQSAAKTKTYDAGLRAHMSRIYNRMVAGVLVTGLVSWFVANTPALYTAILGNQILFFIIAFAPLGVIMFGFNPNKMAASKLRISFFVVSVLYGLSFSSIFLAFAGADIARAFFLAAIAFSGLSLFGYTTKKNLDGFGSFLVMGMFGLLALSILNIFIASSLMQNVVAGAGILIFGGLVAYETQRMKESYHDGYGDEANSRMGWMSALNLYISFVALFQYILHFVGSRD